MEIKFDRVADAVYVNVAKGAVTKTLEVRDLLNVDLDSAGNIVGIELLEASSQHELVKNLEQSVASGVPVSILAATPSAA